MRALSSPQDHTRELLDRIPDVIARFNLGFRYLYVNRAIERVTGRRAEQLIGRTFEELGMSSALAAQWRATLERALDEVREQLLEFSLETPAGERRFETRVVPELDGLGRVATLLAVTRDITRATQAHRFLAEASVQLSRTLDSSTIYQQLAGLAVPTLADWCTLHALQPDGRLAIVAVAHPDPEKEAHAWEVERKHPVYERPDAMSRRVLRTGASELVETVSDAQVTQSAANPDHLAALRAAGMRSVLCVPLQARGRPFATMTFVSTAPGRRYGQSDLRLAEDLAQRAALAIENARLFEQEAQASQAKEAARARAEANERALREESRITETLYRIGASFSRELDQERLLQLVTDETTQLTGARFGAFFFNAQDEQGHVYLLHTLSGADRERFERFPSPRVTPLFEPTFKGAGTVRLDDVRADPRFGAWGRQPEGHPAVVSYLAVPVKTGGGEVLGGLLFGHPEPGRFTAQHERILEGISAHAAVALQNARLYQTVRRQKEQLTQAVERAQAADRRKDEFLAMLGHELRNPLAPISTAVHLMKLKGAGGEKERSIIERQVRHLSRLVDDLLDVSRITRGKIELRKERIELGSVIAKAIEMASPLLEKFAHQIELDVPREGLPLEADPVRLAQVFQNLLTNAAKYTEPGGIITVLARREGDEVLLRVRDTGMGISAEMLPHVFDAFVQGPRTIDRAEGGLGLGLTLVRQLVTLHGGRVTARSEGPGRGSEFEVALPLSEQPAEGTRPPLEPMPRAAKSAARRKVLIVDDNVDAACTLADMIELLGGEAQVAHDGPEALAVVSRFQPDVAVLDIGLPVMDGYELCARLREHLGTAVHLVAVTGYGQDADREHALKAGFAAHLVKPVSRAAIEALLDPPAR